MDGLTIRSTPPDNYFPPTALHIHQGAQELEIENWSSDLVADLTNVAAGGELKDPSEIRPQVEEYFKTKSYKEPDLFVRERQKLYDIEKAMKYHESMNRFVKGVDLYKFPGDTPLQKALSCTKLLLDQKKKGKGKKGDQNGDGENGNKFEGDGSDGEGMGEASEQLNELMDKINAMSPEELELLLNSMNPEKGCEPGKSAGKSGHLPLKKLRAAEDIMQGKDKLAEIAKKLDTFTKMSVRRLTELKPDPDGDEVRVRPIKSFNEINRIVKTEWAFSSVYRSYRIITQASMIREKVRREDKKQLIYMIVDSSGSMHEQNKMTQALGVLMNRLKAVMVGDAEMYFRFFDTDLHKEKFIRTRDDALKAMADVKEKNFSGGGTAIDNCLRMTEKRIDELMKCGTLHRPEIVIVTDGEDHVHATQKDFQGTRIHAFVVGGHENTELLRLAVQTGGAAIANICG